jgi:hypothetical protein
MYADRKIDQSYGISNRKKKGRMLIKKTIQIKNDDYIIADALLTRQ